MKKSSKLLWNIAAFGLLAFSITVAVTFVIGLRHGFSPGNDGYMLLSFTYPDAVYAALSSFRFYGALLMSSGLDTVFSLRLATFTMLLVSGLFFAACTWRSGVLANDNIAGSQLHDRLILISAALFAVVIAGTWAPFGVSRNTLNSAFTLTSGGLLILGAGVVLKQKCKHSLVLLALIAGVLCGLHFFIRPPAASIFLGLWVVMAFGLLLWVPGGTRRIALLMLLSLGLGACAGVSLHFTIFESFKSWLDSVGTALMAYGADKLGGSSDNLVVSTYAEVWNSTKRFFRDFWPAWTLLVVLEITRCRRSPRIMGFYGLGLWLVILVFAVRWWWRGRYLGDSYLMAAWLSVIVMLMTVVVIRWGAARFNFNPVYRPHVIGGAICFLLPLIGALGTSGGMLTDSMHYSLSWLVLILLLLIALGTESRVRIVAFGLIFIGMSVQYYGGFWKHPINLPDARWAATERWEIPGQKDTVHIHKEMHGLLTEVSRALKEEGFQPGDPVLAFYDHPGIVYLLGGSSPGLPWIFSPGDFSMTNNLVTEVLSRLPRDQIGDPYVLLVDRQPADIERELRALGSQPDDLRLVFTWNGKFRDALEREVRLYVLDIP